MKVPPRVVLDTNLVLSALVFSRGRLAELRLAWQAGHIRPLISEAAATELMRALAYPKFALTSAQQADLLADYLPWCETIRVPGPPPSTPPCRDPDDIKFLQLAVTAGADLLVTGDKDLLDITKPFACPIIPPAALLDLIRRA